MHAKLVLYVLGQGMNLKRKVAAAHGVEKVETDGKLFTEARVDRFAE